MRTTPAIRRYYRLKKEGICVVCGRRKAIEGISFCEICREKKRQSRERNKKKYWKKNRLISNDIQSQMS